MSDLGQSDIATRAFSAFYREQYGFVWYALQRLGTGSGAVEDALQDVFVVAYRRRTTFDGPSQRAWLYGIARRVASNYRRSHRRRRQRIRALRDAQPRVVARDINEAIQTLDRYLAGLTPVDREIFVLAEVEGMTGPEIAEAFGRNLQTIYTRIRKLRRGFRAEVSDVDAIKRAHPKATASSWAALTPLLAPPSVPVGTGWTAALTSTWLAAALGAAAAAGGLVLAHDVFPAPTPERAETAPSHQRLGPVVHRVAAASSDPARHTEMPPTPAALGLPAGPVTVRDSRPVGSNAQQRTARKPSLHEENALLREAADAVRQADTHKALQLTDAHAEGFPSSVFSDLRSAIRIQALCVGGKLAQARGERAIFFRRYPNSAAARRVEKKCADPAQTAPRPDKSEI